MPPAVDPLQTIQIETTAACNAACRFCPHPDMTRKGRMSEALFHSIIEQGLAMGVTHYYPFLLNEPLAEVRLPQWMDWLNSQGGCFSLFTNAELLTPEKSQWLLACPNLHALWISFYGATKETYEHAMQGLSFDVSEANVRYVIAAHEARILAGQRSAQHLYVRMSVYEDTAGEEQAFRDKWGRYAAITGHVNWAGARPSVYARLDLPQWPCLRIMDQLYINVLGQAVLCCLDAHSEVILGDVTKEPLADVWRRAQGFRDAHKRYDFDHHLCRTCSLNRSQHDPWNGKYPRPVGA